MKWTLFFLLVALLNFSDESKALMPKSWYQLSDVSEKSASSSSSWEKPSQDFDKEVMDLFEAQGDSYDALLQESEYALDKSINNWELSVIRSQLALTAGGVLGVLALKGTVAAELRWFKKSFVKELKLRHDIPLNDAAHATIDTQMSDAAIEQVLISIADKAVATGRISNKELMLDGLKHKINETKKMLFRVPDTTIFPFSLHRLRLEIIFGSSGRVLPFMTAGGSIRIRLDWELLPTGSVNKFSSHSSFDEDTNSSFEELVKAMSQDMNVLVAREPFGSKFRVKGFQIRIAQTASGQVGVANASGSFGGMLFFRKNHSSNKSNQAFTSEDGGAFNLIRVPKALESSHEPSYILSDKFLTSSFQDRGKVISIDRNKFRQGLKKAEKIGSYFIGKANQVKNKNWELREIRTDYQLSLAGSVGLATIGGFGELRVEYTKNN